jgi:NADH-quinone oxidoreductase subunit F
MIRHLEDKTVPEKKILIDKIDEDRPGRIESYGGFKALKKALSMSPEDVIQEIKARVSEAGAAPGSLRRQMGNGPKNAKGEKILICNADEGEVGTFKDRHSSETTLSCCWKGWPSRRIRHRGQKAYIYLRDEYRIC